MLRFGLKEIYVFQYYFRSSTTQKIFYIVQKSYSPLDALFLRLIMELLRLLDTYKIRIHRPLPTKNSMKLLATDIQHFRSVWREKTVIGERNKLYLTVLELLQHNMWIFLKEMDGNMNIMKRLAFTQNPILMIVLIPTFLR